MAQVVFDVSAFRLRYPEFDDLSDALLGDMFDEATLYLSNSDSSPVSNLERRARLLNMLVAHLAFLHKRQGIVGRVSNATEGSVSVASEYVTPGSGAWFNQSQYGASFWAATTSLRGFRYVPRPTVY
jgi:hypothetical protein